MINALFKSFHKLLSNKLLNNSLNSLFKFEITHKHFAYLLIILISIFVNMYFGNYKENLNNTYASLEVQENLVRKFSNSELNFIKTHSLSIDNDQFINFIKSDLKKLFGQLNSIDLIQISKICNIKVNTFAITLAFWHDKFIFDFLDKLSKYGFVRVTEVHIERSEEYLQQPGLIVKLLCNLYQE